MSQTQSVWIVERVADEGRIVHDIYDMADWNMALQRDGVLAFQLTRAGACHSATQNECREALYGPAGYVRVRAIRLARDSYIAKDSEIHRI